MFPITNYTDTTKSSSFLLLSSKCLINHYSARCTDTEYTAQYVIKAQCKTCPRYSG